MEVGFSRKQSQLRNISMNQSPVKVHAHLEQWLVVRRKGLPIILNFTWFPEDKFGFNILRIWNPTSSHQPFLCWTLLHYKSIKTFFHFSPGFYTHYKIYNDNNWMPSRFSRDLVTTAGAYYFWTPKWGGWWFGNRGRVGFSSALCPSATLLDIYFFSTYVTLSITNYNNIHHVFT